ncbi:hypothetical protein M6D81_29515 [Paenibacillus sp. J5C_2022]|uniref:hypothetical protein n=1 Tax=Paenibacillus sp. J5C2022 TaxID=2977129 RepID=UPI0021D3CE2E|nr:hypothetical protein [Paenibacillus sp. J5C2022]MCU6712848.1 hypothetical protein [Paenibacillus sp. J5C2022]
MSFDDLLKELQEQRTNQEDASNLTLDKLFNESFMSEYTNSKSFREFLEKGNFQAWTQEDLVHIEGELLDRHVARETSFADWNTMLDKAKASI